MKKFLKRLPVLILALIVAVMPVMMAVPARADEVDLYSYNGVVLPNIDSVWTDKNYYKYALIYNHVDSGSVRLAYGVTVDFGSSDYLNFTGLCYVYVLNDNVWTFLKSDAGIRLNYSDMNQFEPIWSCFNILNPDGSVRFSSSDPVLYVEPPNYLGDDIFPVFSLVGSWFSSFTLGITEVFFVDGSLTFLGILAVAGLALAVMLLLIYLIAGWLKFR